MKPKKIVISGTGCALADLIYNRVSFSSSEFQKYISKQNGDGGLSPGKLVFTEELEQFSGLPYATILREIVGNRPADAMNVGGPSLVSLIHAAQMLDRDSYEVQFYGIAGNDDHANMIVEKVTKTPLNIDGYSTDSNRTTPTTDVLSDPDYDHGHGERTFVNNIGAAWDVTPEQLGDAFFSANIQCYGGTALVPNLHDNLSELLKRSKENNSITVVNTVFDFRNQKRNPGKPWPLLGHTNDFRLIDVLIMDCEEALKISGTETIDEAALFFKGTGVQTFIITNGAKDLVACSNGGLFPKTQICRFPVSRMIGQELTYNPALRGDTTGCGDNFAGGIITSLALQLARGKKEHFDLTEAISWGVSSGGFCCFTVGGTYLETTPGEKREKIEVVRKDYLDQLKD